MDDTVGPLPLSQLSTGQEAHSSLENKCSWKFEVMSPVTDMTRGLRGEPGTWGTWPGSESQRLQQCRGFHSWHGVGLFPVPVSTHARAAGARWAKDLKRLLDRRRKPSWAQQPGSRALSKGSAPARLVWLQPWGPEGPKSPDLASCHLLHEFNH